MGRFVFVTAVSIWLGTVVSFSFLVLPAIHDALEGTEARGLLQRIFPRYYVLGIACGLIALSAVSLAPPSPTLPPAERWRLALPVAVSLLCTLATRSFLHPRLTRIRYEDAPEHYERLHRFSAMLNSTVMAMLVLAAAAIATR